jgi:hypothetical protein
MARFCRTPISTLHSLDLRTRLPQAENVLLLRFRAASDQCLRLRKRRVGYAFCPTCISLQPYVHVRWDWAFPALLRCHVHKSPLRRGCPMCGEDDPLPFAAPALASILCWSCGAHLTGASLGSHVGHVNGTYAVVERVYRVALRGTSPDYALMGEATGTQFRRFVDDLLQLLAWYPSPELSPRSTDPQNHHRLLVNIETSAMRMQKFHRSSSAPLAWSPDRRNLESVLRGGKPPVATIRGAQGFRVRLLHGLMRTNLIPTSMPATRKHSTPTPLHVSSIEGRKHRWGTVTKLFCMNDGATDGATSGLPTTTGNATRLPVEGSMSASA